MSDESFTLIVARPKSWEQDPEFFLIPNSEDNITKLDKINNFCKNKKRKNLSDEEYEDLWLIRAALSEENEWVPKTTPPEWNKSFLKFKITPPILNSNVTNILVF